MNKFDELLKDTKKIKKFQFKALHSNKWHDVLSINKKNRTIRLYNEYGCYITSLDKIQDLKKQTNFWD